MKKRKNESNEHILMLIKDLNKKVSCLEKDNDKLKKENDEFKQKIKENKAKAKNNTSGKPSIFSRLIFIIVLLTNGILLCSIALFYTSYSKSRFYFYITLAFAALVYIIVIVMKILGKIKLKSFLNLVLYFLTLTTILLGANLNINCQNSLDDLALKETVSVEMAKQNVSVKEINSAINKTKQAIKTKDAIYYEHYASQFLTSLTITLPTFTLLFTDAEKNVDDTNIKKNNINKEKNKEIRLK